MRSVIIVVLFTLCSALSASAQQATQQQAATQFPAAKKDATITHRIIEAPNGTFGYEILSDGKLLVHQTNIPGRPGNNGCRTKEEAERLAALVITKVKKGEMPPTVMKEELDELKITR